MKKDIYQKLLRATKSTRKSAEKLAGDLNKKGEKIMSQGSQMFGNKDKYFKDISKKLQQIQKKSPKMGQNFNPDINSLLGRLNQQSQQLSNATKQYQKTLKDKLNQSSKTYQENLDRIRKRVEESGLNVSESGQKIKQSFQKIYKQSQNLAKAGKQMGKKVSQTSQKAREKTNQFPKRLKESSKSVFEKLNFKKQIQSTLNFLFWRALLILGVAALCYGIGKAIPGQFMRLLRQEESATSQRNQGSRFVSQTTKSDYTN